MGFGFVVFKADKRIKRFLDRRPAAPDNSNNVAEYLALNAALDWFIDHDLIEETIMVKGDSRLVLQQMFGPWKIKQGAYVGEAMRAKRKLTKFTDISGRWISREYNTEADALSRKRA